MIGLSGVGQALGVRSGEHSLDDALRICRMVTTELTSTDIRVRAVEDLTGAHL
jgi:hypothetical protein